jgi:porin
VGGTGLISGRSRDTWGFGYYYDALSNPLKDAVSLIRPMRNEGGWEMFYNFSVTPWLELGANLEVIRPSLGQDMAVFAGLRTVIRF